VQKHTDLQEIVSAWPGLPENIKAEIKALVKRNKKVGGSPK